MLVNRKGIICRAIKYGESSLILDIFSADTGMKSYICSGVRKKRSSKSAILQVMNFVDFICYVKSEEKASLLRIKEIKYHKIYKNIPFDIVRGTLGMFLLEVTRKAIHQTDDSTPIYAFIESKFSSLDDSDTVLSDFHIVYMIQLAQLLGFEMQNNFDDKHPYFSLKDGMFIPNPANHRFVLDQDLSELLFTYLKSIRPVTTKRDRIRLLESLVSYYAYHIDSFGSIKSLEVLQSLYDT